MPNQKHNIPTRVGLPAAPVGAEPPRTAPPFCGTVRFRNDHGRSHRVIDPRVRSNPVTRPGRSSVRGVQLGWARRGPEIVLSDVGVTVGRSVYVTVSRSVEDLGASRHLLTRLRYQSHRSCRRLDLIDPFVLPFKFRGRAPAAPTKPRTQRPRVHVFVAGVRSSYPSEPMSLVGRSEVATT